MASSLLERQSSSQMSTQNEPSDPANPADLPQPLQSMGISNPKRRYAVYFDEGPGYLLVDHLSDQGSYSTTMLVQSLEDYEIYVRKLHDLQLYEPELAIQCADQRYWCIVNQELVDSTGKVEQRAVKYITPVTIWELCNGGPVNEMFHIWGDGDDESRVPEAVVWNFLTTILKTLIEINRKGIIHRDTHEGNFLLHWPLNAEVPELFLADFGIAAPFPNLRDPTFCTPWTGAFNDEGLADSEILSQNEKSILRKWYISAYEDMRHTIKILQSIILAGRDIFWPGWDLNIDHFFEIMAKQRESVNGYSAELVQAVVAWSSILTKLWADPPVLMNSLMQLHASIRSRATTIVRGFLANPLQAHRETSWMRQPFPRERPAVWKDPTELLQPQQPPLIPGRLSRCRCETEAMEQEVIGNYFEGDTHSTSPRITVETLSMNGSLSFRRDQFRVAELLYNENTYQWQFVRLVDSLDEVQALSPDDDIQHNWGIPNDIAGNYEFLNPTGTGDNDNDNDNNDDNDDELLPHTHHKQPQTAGGTENTPIQISSSPDYNDGILPCNHLTIESPYPAPYWTHVYNPANVLHTTSVPNAEPDAEAIVPDFIYTWTNTDPPYTNGRPPFSIQPMREPIQLPEDSDEDTSIGRRYRAYKKVALARYR